MENYKDKYDIIVSKLLELIEKEKLLNEKQEALENNKKNSYDCDNEIEELKSKFYDMRSKAISLKMEKCGFKSLLIFIFNGLVSAYIGVNFFPGLWIAVLYLISLLIVYKFFYINKLNDKEYLFGELERSSEYIDLEKQIKNKANELSRLTEEYERLDIEMCDLKLEVDYLYVQLIYFTMENDYETQVDVALVKDYEYLREYAEKKGLVRKRVKDIDKKKDE